MTQRLSRRTTIATAVVGTALTLGGCIGFGGRGDDGANWPSFACDAANSGHSPRSGGPTDGVGPEWTTAVAHDRVGQPVIVDGDVYAGSNRGEVADAPRGLAVALDREGEERWSFETDGPADNPTTVTEDGVYLSSESGRVYALDRDGGERWQFDAGAGDCTVTATDEAVYATGASKNLYALTPEGEREWTFTPGEDVHVRGVPAVGARGVYTGGTRLYAVDDSGSGRWSYGSEGYAVGTPVLGDDAVHVVEFDPRSAIDSSDRYVVAVDAAGEERWRSALAGAMAVATSGTTVVASTTAGVVALEPGSGDVRWRYACAYPTRPALAGEVVVVTTRRGTALGIDVSTGDRLWRSDLEDGGPSPPSIAGDGVFVGTKAGEIRKLSW